MTDEERPTEHVQWLRRLAARTEQVEWLRRLAAQEGVAGPDAAALVLDARRIGYEDLSIAAAETREGLRRIGIERGDLVAVLAPPSLEGVVLIHAMLDLGVVFLPLNARLTEMELRRALESTRARYLIVSGEAGGPEGPGEMIGVRLVESLETGLLVFAGSESESPRGLELTIRRAPAGMVEGDLAERRAGRVEQGAALVLLTSGTSGQPKGAVLTFANLISSAIASAELLGSRATDRWLLCMPLFHIGGLSILIRSALAGACVHLHPGFDSRAVARAIEEEGITHVSFVAAMLERVLDARGDQSSPAGLQLVLLGGGPASQNLLSRAESLGYPIAPTYGLTEAASQVATRPPNVAGDPGGDLSGGLIPLPGVEVRIAREGSEEVAAESVREGGFATEGEIEVRGPIVMAGYLDDREATRQVLREGWLSTGDFGRIDSEGRLRVLDRRADLIVSGGENVYPAEIESILVEFEGVREAGVFGVRDPDFGARPIAVVVMHEGAHFDPVALERFCRERMASFKRPVDFREAESLPRTATGKLRRRDLRAQFG